MKTISAFVAQADPLLVDAANVATTTIAATPANYAITSGNATTLASRATAFATAFEELTAAKNTYEAAIKTKDAARELFTDLFVQLLTTSVNTPSVTDANLALIGLLGKAPRQVRPLRQPLSLEIGARPSGFLEFKWRRNQNTTNTIFLIQQRFPGDEWETVWSGTKVRTVLEGYPIGVPVTFRVVATKSEEFSEPSNEYTVYGSGGAGALQAAA